jgi:cell division protein FtsB
MLLWPVSQLERIGGVSFREDFQDHSWSQTLFQHTSLSIKAVNKKHPNSKATLAQFVAIIALSISIFLIIDLGRRAAANYRIQREAERLTQEVEAAKRYQAKLLAQRTYAASDLYVEEVARNELKWAKPGETVIVVIPQYEETPHLPSRTGEEEQQPIIKTPQQAWWQLFFGEPPFTEETP